MATIDEFRAMVTSGVKQRRYPGQEEHNTQAACVRWFRAQYPYLRHNLFAVPNGGWRTITTAARLKEEGVLAGVADLILLKSNAQHGALLIEMKTRKGHQEDVQKEWQRLIELDGYRYVVCRSIDDFMREVNGYLANVTEI